MEAEGGASHRNLTKCLTLLRGGSTGSFKDSKLTARYLDLGKAVGG